MLSLLAIEQLTGAVTARQVGLGGGSASSSVGDKADQAASDLAKADSDVKAAQSALTKAQETQASDGSACTKDPNSASCSKSADDKTAVDNAQSALDKANQAQKTAQDAMQAARGAVKADASGARISFADATKTNQITDESARYIAETTRTIVTTTLLASFAQEECTRLWDYINYNTKLLDSAKQPDALSRFLGTAVTENSVLASISRNCSESQKTLFSSDAIFAPQYGAAQPRPLQVLSGQGEITMALKGSAVHFIVIGGVPPYHIGEFPPDVKKELTAAMPEKPTKGVYELTIERPSIASKTSGKATIYVVDSASTVVEVPVTLSGTAVDNTPKANQESAATITDVTFANGKITLKFTVPGSAKTDTFTATATNTNGKGQVLNGSAQKGAKQVDISGCTAGDTYKVTLDLIPPTGPKSIIDNYDKPVTCTAVVPPVAAPPPAPAAPQVAKAPDVPTIVDVKVAAGRKISVSFTAPVSDGGSAITDYTATAVDVKGGGNPITGSTSDGKVAPITLSGCTAGDSYVITLVAKNGVAPSQPAKGKNPVKCEK